MMNHQKKNPPKPSYFRQILLLFVVAFFLSTIFVIYKHSFLDDPPPIPPATSSSLTSLASKTLPSAFANLFTATTTKPLHLPRIISQATPSIIRDKDLGILRVCAETVEERLREPALSPVDYQWCKDRLDPAIGGVVVGKSWGNLKDIAGRQKFEALSCNNVHASASNPSCTDSWGDSHVYNWRRNRVVDKTCSFAKSPMIKNLFNQSISAAVAAAEARNRGKRDSVANSRIQCFKNEMQDMYCTFTNVLMNFSAFDRIPDPNGYDSTRKWHKNFFTIPCNEDNERNGIDYEIPDFKLSHLFSSSIAHPEKSCDVFIPGTTIIYSHDIVMNLAHTLNDIMNVWLLLWLEGIADQSQQINLLTVDSMKSYHNWDDPINQFFYFYQNHFHRILRGIEFRQQHQSVCFERVITQPLSPRGFVWQQWTVDALCSFVGPASLFQRWNVHIRKTMSRLRTHNSSVASAVVAPPSVVVTSEPEKILILLIYRNQTKNMWGTYRSSRIFRNLPAMKTALIDVAGNVSTRLPVEIMIEDFDTIPSFEKQLELMSKVHILIGMHGAGMAHLNVMSVGSPYCCGVIEFFPRGEFFDIRGFGNMARRMGIHYERIEISHAGSRADGAKVPIERLQESVTNVLHKIEDQPSCLLPGVLNNLYFTK